MSWSKHDYDNIPGTYVFDGKTAANSYGLNKLLFSFNHAENRKAFDDAPSAYAEKFDLTPQQRRALLESDFLELIRCGANIYFLAKLAVPKGVSVQDAGAAFQGITTEEFKANLNAKADNLVKKLNDKGGYWSG